MQSGDKQLKETMDKGGKCLVSIPRPHGGQHFMNAVSHTEAGINVIDTSSKDRKFIKNSDVKSVRCYLPVPKRK